MRINYFIIIAVSVATSVNADTESRIQYLANEGVAVFHNGTTLLFDPLFRNDYGHYVLVPDNVREAMFTASKPFEDVTAVFVSHHHGDHFDPADMLRLMAKHTAARLYAPRQALDAMKRIADDDDASIFDRAVGLDLSYGDKPRSIQSGHILVEAFYVPHSGWPTARTDVQNIAFKVTVDNFATIAHLGDADPNLLHFETHAKEWQRQPVEASLPPYWFFNSRDGNQILEGVIRAQKSIGIHVPANFSDSENVPNDLRDFDLFVRPGESRPWVLEAQ